MPPTRSRPLLVPLLALAVLSLGAAPPLLERAFDHHRRGETREALEAYAEAAVALRDTDPASAATAHNNACVLRINLGEYEAARQECRAALELRRRQGDPILLARALNNLGLVAQSLGAYERASDLYREALSLNEEGGDPEGQAINRSILGLVASLAGRYDEALALYRSVVVLASAHADAPWAAEQERLALLNQGVALETLGAYQEALDLYRGLLGEAEAMEPRHRAALQANVGVVYRNLGDPVRARELIRSAAEIFAAEQDPVGLANALLNLGIVEHRNLGDPRAAETSYRRALALAREAGDRTEEILVLLHLGDALVEQERLGEARTAFEEALADARETGSSAGIWSALGGLGRVAEARGDASEALGHLSAAVEEVEKVRADLADPELRSGYFAERRSVYEGAVRALVDLHGRGVAAGHAERAFELVQRAKARELVDVLRADVSAASPLAVDELGRAMGPRDVLVEYFFAGDRLVAWMLREGHLRMVEIDDAEAVTLAVRRVHGALAGAERPAEEDLALLSRSLLSRFPLPDGDEIRIAADGALRYLPFELLTATRGGPPLITRSTVSYLPSASALGHLRRSRSSVDLAFLGLGDPRLPATDDGAASPAGLLASRLALPPLPAASEELRRAAEQLRGESVVLTGEEATEAAFRRIVERGARVAHLATHTVLGDASGAGGVVLLAPGEGEDGLLRSDEIARLTLDVDLAVLAACRSGLPGSDPGGGIGSLTGAFLAAGSPAVVASLWEVDDAVTEVFMDQLYHYLAAGHRPAEALRRTKLRLLENGWDEPFLWSAFVVVGSGVSVARGSSRWVALLIVAVLVGLGLAVLVARRRRSR